MIKKTTAWIFLLSSVIINGIYLFLVLTHKVKLTNFAIILISFFGIFTTIAFGEVILKEKRNGNSKTI
jgi:hypothetical protein